MDEVTVQGKSEEAIPLFTGSNVSIQISAQREHFSFFDILCTMLSSHLDVLAFAPSSLPCSALHYKGERGPYRTASLAWT
jgi:hypothetical protein